MLSGPVDTSRRSVRVHHWAGPSTTTSRRAKETLAGTGLPGIQTQNPDDPKQVHSLTLRASALSSLGVFFDGLY
ncbi:MAG: hypothetical protein ACOC6G_02430 [Thermoproteota archaeon]